MRVLFIILVFIFAYTSVLSGQNLEEICEQAQKDAVNDTDKFLWFYTGFIFSFPLGWPIFPMFFEPNVPNSKILGIPKEHIEYYKKCYKIEAKQVQQKNALGGCFFSILFYLILYFSTLD